MGSGLPSINFEFRNDDNKRSRMSYYLFYTVSYPLKYCIGIHTRYFRSKWYIFRKNFYCILKTIVILFCFVVFCLIQLFMHLFIQRNHAVWVILYDFIGSILHLPHSPIFWPYFAEITWMTVSRLISIFSVYPLHPCLFFSPSNIPDYCPMIVN